MFPCSIESTPGLLEILLERSSVKQLINLSKLSPKFNDKNMVKSYSKKSYRTDR